MYFDESIERFTRNWNDVIISSSLIGLLCNMWKSIKFIQFLRRYNFLHKNIIYGKDIISRYESIKMCVCKLFSIKICSTNSRYLAIIYLSAKKSWSGRICRCQIGIFDWYSERNRAYTYRVLTDTTFSSEDLVR